MNSKITSSLDFKLKAVPRNSAEEGKKVKEVISELIKEIKALVIYSSTDEMKEEILSTKPSVEVIIDIIKDSIDVHFKNKSESRYLQDYLYGCSAPAG